VSSGNRPSSDFAAMLLEVFFIPKIDLQNLEWTFSMLNLYINDKISQSRINCKKINPLVQEAFKLNKTLSQDDI
jgi:hypothetical protein